MYYSYNDYRSSKNNVKYFISRVVITMESKHEDQAKSKT